MCVEVAKDLDMSAAVAAAQQGASTYCSINTALVLQKR